MVRQSERLTTLLAQDLALDAYLDALLQESTEARVEAPVRHAAAAPAVESISAEASQAPATALVFSGAQTRSETPADYGVPEWGREKFQCLLFFVGSLKLAVPLVKLTRIKPWGEHVTATPGRPPWFLGLLAQGGVKTGVIDTARLVFARDRRSQAADPAGEADEPGHILMVEDGRWGLTCDRLGEVVELSPDAVRWRSGRTARRWLAGTVLDQMCALLDVEMLARMAVEDEVVQP